MSGSTNPDGIGPSDAALPVGDDPYIPPPGTRVSGIGLGIDVGGTGVKAALVDLESGELVTSRVREKTPQPATPDAVADTIRSVVARVNEEREIPPDTPVGCGVPAVVKFGRLMTAANIDKSWIGTNCEELVGQRLGRPVFALNDADAAGLAEMAYGAGQGRSGTILLLTIGTGIGTALFIDGRLVPNTELGHLEMKGKDAETRVSGAARERRKLSWKEWAREFDRYLDRIEAFLWPDLLILGGGVSKELERYRSELSTRVPVVAARFLNLAGIIGAAYAAASARQVTTGSASSAPLSEHAPAGLTHAVAAEAHA